jgi:hypothetical protein
MTPTGGIAPKKVARLENAIHAYEGALEDACKKVRQCTYDGGALGRIVDRRDYYSDDLNHFNRGPRPGRGRRLGSHASNARPAPLSQRNRSARPLPFAISPPTPAPAKLREARATTPRRRRSLSWEENTLRVAAP